METNELVTLMRREADALEKENLHGACILMREAADRLSGKHHYITREELPTLLADMHLRTG